MKSKFLFIGPSLNGGGLERVLSLLVNKSVDSGFKVDVVLLNLVTTFYSLNKGVKVYGLKNKLLSKHKALRYGWFTGYIFSRMLFNRYHKIYCFGESYNSLAIFCGLLTRSKVVVSNRASPLSSTKGKRFTFNRFFYPYAEAVVLQTSKARDMLIDLYPSVKFLVIPNPTSEFDHSQLPRKNVVLNVGSLRGLKNQEELIQIFHEVNNLDWELWFAGKGPNEKLLKEMVAERNLSSNVKFLGQVSDIEEYYKMAKIFAFTSLTEGFPNALLEAQSLGCAVVSYDCIAGPSDLIQDKSNGFLIPMQDHDSYVSALKQLMADSNLLSEIASNAAQSAKKYNLENVYNAFLEVKDFQ